MRSVLLSMMFCLISSVIWSESVTWADLVENPGDGLVYKKFQATPFTGAVTATADDPVQRSYQDGVKDGEWFEFDANGLVKSNFENQIETTKEEYKYYRSGQLAEILHFEEGKYHGLGEWYFENGQLSIKSNEKLTEEYFMNGQLKVKTSRRDGEHHGLWEEYYKSGQLETEENYVEGLCCTNYIKDSPHESSLVAGMYEQLIPHKIQDNKLVVIQ